MEKHVYTAHSTHTYLVLYYRVLHLDRCTLDRVPGINYSNTLQLSIFIGRAKRPLHSRQSINCSNSLQLSIFIELTDGGDSLSSDQHRTGQDEARGDATLTCSAVVEKQSNRRPKPTRALPSQDSTCFWLQWSAGAPSAFLCPPVCVAIIIIMQCTMVLLGNNTIVKTHKNRTNGRQPVCPRPSPSLTKITCCGTK